jgi:hypothetical protein
VREGLECQKPDIDGRKTRWKKRQANLETDLGIPNRYEGSASASRAQDNGQGGSDERFAGGLFDLLLGEFGVKFR